MSCCNTCNTSPCCCKTPFRYLGPNIDCLGIVSNSTYDSLFQLLANEICDLNTIADGLEGVDHVSFTSSTGTPSNVANQPCETDTYTLWADVSETVSLGTFTILNPCEANLNYADVAWVDRYFGDDSTGQAGRLDLPFLTITAALAASPNVYLRQGEYSESFEMIDGMAIYAEPGVRFIAGGLSYSPNVAASGSFLGYAQFVSNSIPAVLVNNGTLRFECDYVDTTNTGFYVAGSGSLVASMNYLRCSGIGQGFINSFRDTCTVELYIKEFCEGYYSPYFFRGQNTKSFSGDVKITCPISRTLEGGAYGSVRKSVLNVDQNNGGRIEVIGSMECANTTPDTSGDAGVVRFVVSGLSAIEIDITGDLIGGVETGIYRGNVGNLLNFTLTGNITSDTNPMLLQFPNVGSLSVVLNFFNSIIQGAAPSVLGQGLSAYFYNCSFYNSTTDNDVIDLNDTGTNNVTLYFYNCIGEGTGGGSFIADNMTGYSELLGLTFSNSNRPIVGTLTDTWAGFTQIATLVVPKL